MIVLSDKVMHTGDSQAYNIRSSLTRNQSLMKVRSNYLSGQFIILKDKELNDSGSN